jgi:hypothetical protein
MAIRRILISVLFAAGLAAPPLSSANAQNAPSPQPPPPPPNAQSYPFCSPFPLFWPFCIVGAVIGAVATIVTAPFWALTVPPPYYRPPPPPPYYPPPPPPPYYAPGNYPPPNYPGQR